MKSLINIPEKMKALVLYGVGDLRVTEVDVPKLEKGTVLLKIKACGICSSDMPRCFVTGTYHFPTIPGHEFSGQIVAVGDDVDESLLGKRSCVFLCSLASIVKPAKWRNMHNAQAIAISVQDRTAHGLSTSLFQYGT